MTYDFHAHNRKLLDNIIGQPRAKKEILFYLDSYLETRIFPPSLLVAAIGQGKTTLSTAIAKGLYEFNDEGIVMIPKPKNPAELMPKLKTFVEVNCASLTNETAFVNSFLIPHIVDKDVTVFFDEAGKIPVKIATTLLSMLNPNPQNVGVFAGAEYTADIHFNRQSFLFATSDSQMVLPALRDRLERFSLQDYTIDDLAKIVQKGCAGVTFEDGVLVDIAAVTRGNARSAQKMSIKINAYLRNSKMFLRDDWEQLKQILSIAPLGLNSIELNILFHLASNTTGTSLTCLSAKTGLSRENLRLDNETYLLKHGLIEVVPSAGRVLSAKGMQYLKDLPAYFAAA